MKRWYESKTIWANIIIFSLLFLGYLLHEPVFTSYSVQINMAIALLNVALRLITTKKLQ